MKSIYKSLGVGLIEVLVSILILSAGILGLASTHVTGIKMTQETSLQFQANILANDIIERMRANLPVADSSTSYDIDTTTIPFVAGTVDCEANACTGAQIAAWDLNQWESAARATLPNAVVKVSSSVTGATRTYTVVIGYTNKDANQDKLVVNMVL